MRQVLTDAISVYSEDRYAAGWSMGIEKKIRREGGTWRVLAFLADGWPSLSDRTFADAPGETNEDKWASLMDWEPLTADEEAHALRFLARLPHVMASLKDLS